MTLQERFENICEDYLHAFMRKHEFYDAETGEYVEYYWVSDDVGGVVCLADYFITLDEIRYDIDNGVDKDVYFKYYESRIEKEHNINYKHYIQGATLL